jgi:hypothetical protein
MFLFVPKNGANTSLIFTKIGFIEPVFICFEPCLGIAKVLISK